MPYVLKSPNGVYNFTFDWSDLIGTATINTSTWVSTPSGLTMGTTSINGQTTTAYASSGTAGVNYSVVNRITTDAGATEEKSFDLKVEAAANGV